MCTELGGELMRRRLMEFVKEIAGGEDMTHGSFEVTEETSEFSVTGLDYRINFSGCQVFSFEGAVLCRS